MEQPSAVCWHRSPRLLCICANCSSLWVRDVVAASLRHQESQGVSLMVLEATTFVSVDEIVLLMRRYANKQTLRYSQNSYPEDVHHYLVMSLNLTQLSLHIKPCVCRQTSPQDGIRVPAGRDCQVVPRKHRSVRFRTILKSCTLTEMLPFVMAMEEGCYSLQRLCADDADAVYIWSVSFVC